MKIRDLIDLTGVTERQLRFLIAEGFVPPPRGGRATADYGDDHVQAVRRYTKLRDHGFPPSAIRLMMEANEGIPFPVAPGVTLTIDAELLGSGAAPQPLVRAVRDLLTTLLKEKRDA